MSSASSSFPSSPSSSSSSSSSSTFTPHAERANEAEPPAVIDAVADQPPPPAAKRRRSYKKRKAPALPVFDLPTVLLAYRLFPFADGEMALALLRVNRFAFRTFAPSSPARDPPSAIDAHWTLCTRVAIDARLAGQRTLSQLSEVAASPGQCPRLLQLLLERGCEYCHRERTRKVQVPYLLRACDPCMKERCIAGYTMKQRLNVDEAPFQRLPHVEFSTYNRWRGQSSYRAYLPELIEHVTGRSVAALVQAVADEKRRVEDEAAEQVRIAKRKLLEQLAAHPLMRGVTVNEELLFSLRSAVTYEVTGRALELRIKRCAEEYLLAAGRVRLAALKPALAQSVPQLQGAEVDDYLLRNCSSFWSWLALAEGDGVAPLEASLAREYAAKLATLKRAEAKAEAKAAALSAGAEADAEPPATKKKTKGKKRKRPSGDDQQSE